MADYIIIQGDDKHTKVTMTGTGAEQVSSIYFTSKSLGVNKHIAEREADGNFYITFTSKETQYFLRGIHSFDITAITKQNDIHTALYHGTVCVKEKDNSID